MNAMPACGNHLASNWQLSHIHSPAFANAIPLTGMFSLLRLVLRSLFLRSLSEAFRIPLSELPY